MIDASFISKIELLAEQKRAPAIDVAKDPNAFYLREADGSYSRHYAPQPKRSYKLARVADVVKCVRTMHAEEKAPDCYVFCRDGLITVIADENGDRRERLTMQHKASPAFAHVGNLASRWFTPADMTQFCRVELSGCVPTNFMDWIKKLKFTNNATTQSDLQTGRESMGREIENQVTGNGPVPETVVLEVPVFDDLFRENDTSEVARFFVKCIVAIDYAKGQLRLVPIPSDLALAQMDADELIVTQLAPLEGTNKGNAEPAIATVLRGTA